MSVCRATKLAKSFFQNPDMPQTLNPKLAFRGAEPPGNADDDDDDEVVVLSALSV